MKLSLIFLFSFFILCSFIPDANARHHCRSRSSFGLSFNFGSPAPVAYYAAPAPAVAVVPCAPVAPTPYYAPVAPMPYYAPVAVAPAYYAQPVVVTRPAPVYVAPQFSWTFRR